MTKVTIVKNYRNNVTLRQIDLSEAVQMIQEQAYEALCQQLRHVYPLVEVRQKYDAMDGLFNLYTKDIPKVCFTALMENRNKQRIIRAYNGLVLLEVNNLWFRGGRGGAERCQSDSPYPTGLRGCQRTEREDRLSW